MPFGKVVLHFFLLLAAMILMVVLPREGSTYKPEDIIDHGNEIGSVVRLSRLHTNHDPMPLI